LRWPGWRRLPLQLQVVAVTIAGLVLILLIFVALYATDAWKLHLVRETFPGLTRSEALNRLSSMGLRPLPARYGSGWPARDDVAIDFNFVQRPPPPGTCGASAIAILHFVNDRVAQVTEDVLPVACL
jgi:hypothetical protein